MHQAAIQVIRETSDAARAARIAQLQAAGAVIPFPSDVFVAPTVTLGKDCVILSGCIMYTAVTILLPLLAKTVPVILVFQFLSGLGNTCCFALLNGFAISDIEDAKRGAAMGIFQAVYAFGMFLGPLFTGILADHFSIPAGISITGCVGILLILSSLYAFCGDYKITG